jgi:N-acyl-D-aspartate/D-glutamate deacylase
VQPALRDRGVLADGFAADLVIFDPKAINGMATAANPNLYSVGVNWVIVNGEVACRDGVLVNRNGAPVRMPMTGRSRGAVAPVSDPPRTHSDS